MRHLVASSRTTRTQNDSTRAAPDPAAQLVELREAEPVGALDDHHRRRRHVDADLDHGRADEHVQLAVAEAGHLGVTFGGLHPAVDHARPAAGRGAPRSRTASLSAATAPSPSSAPSSIERDDDERPVTEGGLRPDLAPRPVEVGRPLAPVRIGTRPAGGVRRSETSRSAYRTWPRVRGIGVAVISRTCGERPPALASSCAALVDAEAVLLVDDDEAEVGERDGVLDEGVGADDDQRLARRDRLERLGLDVGLERAGQQRHADPELLEQRRRPSRGAGARAGRSGRGGRPGARPARSRRARRRRRRSCPTRRRPGAGGASASGARGRSRIASIAATWSTVSSIGAPTRAADGLDQRRPDRAIRRVVDGDRPARRRGPAVGDARPSRAGARAARRTRAAGAPRRGPRTYPGSGPPRSPGRSARAPPRPRSVGQVLRVGVPGLVERLADRRSGDGPRSGPPVSG